MQIFFFSQPKKKKMKTVLAYLMATYIIAVIYYLFATACIGTPFKASLTPDQRAIKQQAAKQRGRIFWTGLVIGGAALAIFKPI